MRHYAPPAYRVFFEVGNDTGARVKRHIDVLACGIWPSVGHAIHGIEVKVSRSDWKKEMSDPAKSQELMRFCNRWWLAIPAELKISPDEVPDTWGIFTVTPDGKVMTKRPAPKLDQEPLTNGFVAAVLRQAGVMDNDLVEKLARDRAAILAGDAEKRIERGVAPASPCGA